MSHVPPRPPAVVIDSVVKTFEIPREQVHTLKERILHPFRRAGHDEVHALRDVSVGIEPGEFFGIVGRNGSGKSTLLKCLAGIYAVDQGRIYVNGRMSTFIELGVGFNPDLAAYDNVMLNATMLGLSPREARARFDRVIDFAELHEFIDLKLKNYSSGMLVRLAFAVMVQVDADILLIDEVLAVGDAAFQQKCYDEFSRIRERGSTVLLVTHDMSSVRRFCDRAMLLEHGRLVEMGDPELVGNRYLELNFSEQARAEVESEAREAEGRVEPHAAEPEPEPLERHERGAVPVAFVADTGEPSDARAQIVEAWFENDEGRRAEFLPLGRRCAVVMRLRFRQPTADPFVGISLMTDQRLKLLDASTKQMGVAVGEYEAGDEATVRIAFDAIMAPGRYYVDAAVAGATEGRRWMDHREEMVSIVISGIADTDALTALPYDLSVERVGARPQAPVR